MEARELFETTKAEVIYRRQEEVKGSKTARVQRMRDKRREVKEREIEANERSAAAYAARYGQSWNSEGLRRRCRRDGV